MLAATEPIFVFADSVNDAAMRSHFSCNLWEIAAGETPRRCFESEVDNADWSSAMHAAGRFKAGNHSQRLGTINIVVDTSRTDTKVGIWSADPMAAQAAVQLQQC